MKVVCICGKAQAGKDTVGEFLANQFKELGAKPVVIHYADLLKYICKQYFGWNGEKDDAGRTILQKVGTDIVRNRCPDYWVDHVVKLLKVFDGEWTHVIIPDCRFPNEIDGIVEAFPESDITTIRVVRPNHDNGLSEEQKNHPSETALDHRHVQFIVMNTKGLEELENVTASLVQFIGGI